MHLTEDELAAVVRFEIQQAQGYDSSVLSVKRQQALDYYNGLMAEPAEGRSSIVSKDVADSLHSLLSQLAPILKTTLIDFEPNGEEDEPQAQSESDFVRDAIRKGNGWRSFFAASHDALLIANGWLKIDAEDVEKVTTETYPPDLDDAAIFAISQPTAANQTVQVRVSRLKTTVKRTTRSKRLTFESVPPEDMLFSEGPGQEDLDKLRFVGQRKLYTDSALAAMGHSREVIESIPKATASSWPAVLARAGIYQHEQDQQPAQQSQQLREVYCCYQMISSADGLKSERRYVWLGGNHILKNEPADAVPYITGSAVPMPHRIQGTGLYELLQSIQAGKTHILRNYLDNLNVANAGRIGAVEGQVNMSDLTSGRVNGVIRLKSPTALVPVPAMDIGPQSMQGLEYLDHIRTQRVGSSVDINEVQAQVMKSSATAAAGQLAMVEQMAGWFAENLVETLMKPAFLRVHALLRGELAGPIQAKVHGKWTRSDSGQWPERTVCDVTMGMTTAQKAQRVGALSQVITQQESILQAGGGGILTDNAKIYNAMSDWCRANDLHNPEQYLIDPNSQEAQQAQQAKAQQQEQQAKQLQDVQKQLLQLQHAFELEKQRRDLEYKVWSDQLDAEVEEAKVTADNVVKIKQLNQQKAQDDVDPKRG